MLSRLTIVGKTGAVIMNNYGVIIHGCRTQPFKDLGISERIMVGMLTAPCLVSVTYDVEPLLESN